MFLRSIEDRRLAQVAYLIGCQRTGEAIVIDPERDVDRYVALAEREGLRIVAVAETHIHADFLSGARELAERGAVVYVSGEGAPEWSSEWLDARSDGGSYSHRVLRDGDRFTVGNIEFEAIHTPGHTPEHMIYAVTDRGGGASEPMGLCTGDFLFVGDLGRPDLLESAAGEEGAKEPAARQLHASVRRLLEQPDFLQVWPAHGAGSACGKALGAVPQTTVGYERLFNPAIRAATDDRAFVDYILEGQPEPPMYFARMKRENRAGPAVLGSLPVPVPLAPGELVTLDGRSVAIIDTRPWAAFREGHIPGAIWSPLDTLFHTAAGSWIEPDEEIHLVIEPGRVEEAVRELVRIGLDRVRGWFDASDLTSYERAGGTLVSVAEIDVDELSSMLNAAPDDPGRTLVDVRRATEFAEGHLPGAINCAHTRLPARLIEIPVEHRLLVMCRSGARSGRACSFLERQGYSVTNVAGGMLAWEKARRAVQA